MSRYAILSDAHANLEALNAVYEDAESNNATDFYYLGDAVVYGPNPIGCLDKLLQIIGDNSWEEKAVMGNNDSAVWKAIKGTAERESMREFTDHKQNDAFGNISDQAKKRRNATLKSHEWTVQQLRDDPERSLYLSKMSLSPLNIDKKNDFLLVHASPCECTGNEGNYLHELSDAEEAFYYLKEGIRCCFFGHTHRPIIFKQESQKRLYDNCTRDFPSAGYILKYDEGSSQNRFLINPGSVGQPRNGETFACYAILDTAQKQVEFYRVAYSMNNTIKALEDIAKETGESWPNELAQRLKVGA